MQMSFTLNQLWHERNSTKMILLLFLSILVTTYPKYLEFLLDSSLATTYHYFFEKIKNPLGSAAHLGSDTHGSKIAFRLTVPIIGKALGIGSSSSGKDIVLIYLLQSALLLPFLYMLIDVLQRFTSHVNACLFAVACSFTYLCKAFFWDYDFWFDGYAYFFMLAGLYFRKPLPVFFCLQLACWTDERAVVALPGIYLYHLLQSGNFNLVDNFKSIYQGLYSRSGIPVVFAGLVYLLLRLYLGYRYNLLTPSGDQAGVSLSLIQFQLNNRLIGVFLSFEALWFFPFMIGFYQFRIRKFFVSALLGALLLQIIVAYSVFDISRSLSYCFPIFIICLALMAKSAPSVVNRYLPVIALVCILIPTQYLIYFPRQIPTIFSSIDQIALIVKYITSARLAF